MALEKIERNEMPVQDAEKRAKNFEEVALGYSLEMAKHEASRCLNCKAAPCKKGCPVGVNIPEFLQELKAGNIDEASKILKACNSLPSVCGRVCPQETQCEGLCVRKRIDGAVGIGNCERFLGDYMLANPKESIKVKKTGKKVAVIGSGPAGLTCAAELSNNGVDVTMYEAFHSSGGVLVYGIPEFRLPKSLVEAEIKSATANGVKTELNSIVGKTVKIEELLSSFDAVFIGTGAGLPMFMGIPGENLNGVYSANEYLTRVNLMKAYLPDSITPIQKGKHVAVVGAGNVAMDAARTALRIGAEKVSIIYRRGREEMPARQEEIHHAVEEGIALELLTNPVEMLGENGWVKKLKCVRMELGEPDASGRRSPKVIKGSEFELDADLVIVALGTSPNPLIKDSYKGFETSKWGTFIVDENLMTSVENIYAGGDAVTGAATVILAMGAGRKASESILKKLGIK